MKKLSIFNKLFLIFCAALIVFLAVTVPHESEAQKRNIKTKTENKVSEE